MLVVTPEGERVRERISQQMSEPPAALASLPAAQQRELRDLLRQALERG
jgi:hypothetical protein